MEVEVRDDGQIFCRGRQLFAGYWGMPEATRQTFDLDGWFSTGDTGEKDRDGYVSLLGRTSADVIKRGGYKISALQIESTILSHESVEDCSVFGIADDEYGEEIVAVISGGEDLHSMDDHHLRIWLRTMLPEYQVPKYFVRLNQIPRNTMGKVNKISLREHVLSKILR
jgi:malonyl-CoA/methylmalonyl-CoA synthetase